MLYLLSQDQSVEPTEELMVAELGSHWVELGLAEKKPRIGVVTAFVGRLLAVISWLLKLWQFQAR